MKTLNLLTFSVFFLLVYSYTVLGQDSETGKLKIERVVFRPAQWEQEQLHEARNERPNRGGLLFVYYENTTDQAIRLSRFLINDKDQGYYTQSGDVAWTRSYGDKIDPGEVKVYEINAVSDKFSIGKDFSLTLIDRRSWSAIANTQVSLEKDPLHITSIIWQEDLKQFKLPY